MTFEAPYDHASSRTVQVFVSSTFIDMQAERELLVKEVFPRLRDLCARRGAGFAEVDLRWGVTADQVRRGEVIPLCLREIQRCRPYFVALMGERYGWVPDTLAPELLLEWPWMAEYRDRSLTEMEMVFGALHEQAMTARSVFFIRDSSWLDNVPPDKLDDYRTADEQNREKLESLKEAVRRSGLLVVDGYACPQDAADAIYRALAAAIEADFPEQELGEFERLRLQQQVYAANRVQSCVVKAEVLDGLDELVAVDRPPVVISGPSGSGKTTLLAAWVSRFRERWPDLFVFEHHFGSGGGNSSHVVFIRRLMAEIARRHGGSLDAIPDGEDGIVAEFGTWLSRACAREPLVLVLDGVDQIDVRETHGDLYWFPETLPRNLRLVVSTGADAPPRRLRSEQPKIVEIEPLSRADKEEAISLHLKRFGKRLSDDLVQRLSDEPATENPLYLRVLLDEMRVFGAHESLGERLGCLLTAPTSAGLFDLVLQRLERDSGGARETLIRDSLSLLWASRQGLAENELLAILKVAPLVWSPIHLALGDSLPIRAGRIGFADEPLRTAVEHRYLGNPSHKRRAHRLLAEYFAAQEPGERTWEELPWQLASAEEWERLRSTLVDPTLVAIAFDRGGLFDLLGHWLRLEQATDWSFLEACRPLLEAAEPVNKNGTPSRRI